MKLDARLLNGETHSIELQNKREGVEILLDGRPILVRFLKLNGSRCLVYSGGKVIDALVHHEGPQYTVMLNGRAYYIELTDRRLQHASPDDSKGTQQSVKAQMPGRVVKLLKSKGDPVEKNAAVLVIEAMKMQNEIRSPRQGFVYQIAVQEGESVAAGQLLFEIRVEPQL